MSYAGQIRRFQSMTDDAQGVLKGFDPWLPRLTFLFLIVSGVIGLIVWQTGGLRQQNQVQSQADYTALSDKVTRLQTTMDNVSAKQDLLPRPSDWAMQEQHLSHNDSAIADLAARVSAVERESAVSEDRYQRLLDGSQTNVRQPHQ